MRRTSSWSPHSNSRIKTASFLTSSGSAGLIGALDGGELHIIDSFLVPGERCASPHCLVREEDPRVCRDNPKGDAAQRREGGDAGGDASNGRSSAATSVTARP
ncbi:hypothetical protein EYF80_017806 [Liparis tanakae]|uniref:Uncharacterized protein n=1 Tax=Liparis tanakae TaxID=230148 RepID=A0A4Z2I255_9TELE|nr:hypothetical protein EYF80_017806 [Liparis tanakae]